MATVMRLCTFVVFMSGLSTACALLGNPKTQEKIIKTVDVWLEMPDGTRVLVPGHDLEALGEARIASMAHGDGGGK